MITGSYEFDVLRNNKSTALHPVTLLARYY